MIKNKTSYVLKKKYCSLKFSYDRGYMFIELPSGRRLSYYGASAEKGRLSYWGVDQTKKVWVKTDTYGGSLVENITQAIARDCLCDTMYRIYYDAGLPITVMYDIMAVGPNWAKGLPLKGDGYISKYYKKD